MDSSFLRDPASQINKLNTIIPQLIQLYASNAKQGAKSVGQLLEALKSKKLVEREDLEALVLGREVKNEVRAFVITRLSVLIENMVEQTSDIDGFDYLSKLLLDMYQGADVKVLSENPKQPLGKLLVRAMRDQGELQLHYAQLSAKLMDLNLVALVGLNSEMDEVKRKTAYSILSDFPVFDDQKDFNTIIVKSSESVEDDEEEKGDKELSPL